MKQRAIIIALLIFFLGHQSTIQAQTKKNDKDSLYSVIYFGSTDCYYCNIEKNISNISRMVNEIKERFKGLNIKTMIVSMDKDIADGLKFIDKYDTKKWDEISIGSFYNNELALTYLNKTKTPGVPHIVVIKHVTIQGEYNIPHLVEDKVLVDLVGGTEIDKWLQDNYSFKK
jgi:thioredoxin-related protein